VNLAVNGLSFSYNHIPILNDIDFRLESGELLAILGPNGSGKTTLLKCIDGILHPQSGTVTIDEKRIEDYTRSDIAKIIAYVPQSNGRMFPNTVFDTVLLGRKPHIQWAPTNEDLEIVSGLIEQLKLEEFTLRSITELSGGERQKVIIGRALAQEPSILLLDEPTNNLDLKHQMAVLELVKEQTNKGLSVIMALHDLNLALRFADRIMMLHEGSIYAEGGLDVLTPEAIEAVYDVKVSTVEYSRGVFVVPERFNQKTTD